MGSNRRNAANILKGEKELLHYYLSFTEKNIALLEMDWESFIYATTETHHTNSSYITSVLSKLMLEKPVSSRYDLNTVKAIAFLGTLIASWVYEYHIKSK